MQARSILTSNRSHRRRDMGLRHQWGSHRIRSMVVGMVQRPRPRPLPRQVQRITSSSQTLLSNLPRRLHQCFFLSRQRNRRSSQVRPKHSSSPSKRNRGLLPTPLSSTNSLTSLSIRSNTSHSHSHIRMRLSRLCIMRHRRQ
jgi:hypothetical protein